MKVAELKVTETGGRSATTRHIPPKHALAVGMPSSPAPKAWQWSALTDLARLESGHTPSRRHPEYWGGSIPWIGISDARANDGRRIENTEETTNELGIENSSARVLPENTVCLSRTASVGYVVVMGRPMATSQDFVNWVCSKQLDHNFLKYLFIAEDEDLLRFASGSVHQTIYFPEVKAFHICHPPLAEQQRIVGLLDEAFEGLATAKANAEKNLQNARALFESHLQSVFSQRGPGWVEKKLSNVCEITSSLVDPRKEEFLDLTHVGAGNIETKTGVFIELKTAREEELISGKFLFDESMVLYSKIRPYLMKVARPDFKGLCSADMYPLAPFPKETTRDYLFYLLLSKGFTDYAVLGSARAGMPKVNREHLFEFKTWFPDLKKQKQDTASLDALHEETQRLARIYEEKLAALEALKKSLLHQAFSGELTAGAAKAVPLAVPAPVSSTVTSFAPTLVVLPGITTIDLHAGIQAMAFLRHEEHGQHSFGHVKAEKSVHVVEAWVGIELGRRPVKDAAGPVDSLRLDEVGEHARKKGYFIFEKPEGESRFRLTKGPAFDALVVKTERALGKKKAEVDHLLKLLAAMDRRQAEIFTTVHAAWNNLLLDGKAVTDERIVTEARENWHPKKMGIERDRFFKAIAWIREKELVPTGQGKKVMNKLMISPSF